MNGNVHIMFILYSIHAYKFLREVVEKFNPDPFLLMLWEWRICQQFCSLFYYIPHLILDLSFEFKAMMYDTIFMLINWKMSRNKWSSRWICSYLKGTSLIFIKTILIEAVSRSHRVIILQLTTQLQMSEI